MVIAHHLILTGYGHWLPNDPRGSMSHGTHTPRLARLAEAHFGRRNYQPSRAELREFYRKIEGLLAYPVLWFEDPHRQALMAAFGQVARREKLTCYACTVLSNHSHLLIRKHRLKGEKIAELLKDAGRTALREAALAGADHPVFNAGSCDVYKSDPQTVRDCVTYIKDHYRKHNLTPIPCDFVTPYDGWPFHKRTRHET